MKTNIISKIMILSLAVFSIYFMSGCEDMDKIQEMEIRNIEISNITGTTAKISFGHITNGNKYETYPESTRMYYGTSSNVSEMTDFVVGTVEGRGVLDKQLVYNLKNLKQGTQYWFALQLDTIYAGGAKNSISLVNNQGSKGYLIPSDNTFTTLKELPPVDLGLSVLWAQSDLRADEIWFSEKYTWCVTEYKGDDKPTTMNIAGTAQDHATAILGEEWHTPTVLEYRELIDNCDWEIKMNPEWGAYMRFTSRINGNHIDMYPHSGGALAKWEANYWTANVSDLGISGSTTFDIYQFVFSSLQQNAKDWFDSASYHRWTSAQIRPVKKK